MPRYIVFATVRVPPPPEGGYPPLPDNGLDPGVPAVAIIPQPEVAMVHAVVVEADDGAAAVQRAAPHLSMALNNGELHACDIAATQTFTVSTDVSLAAQPEPAAIVTGEPTILWSEPPETS
jgi:hypothetical protein